MGLPHVLTTVNPAVNIGLCITAQCIDFLSFEYVHRKGVVGPGSSYRSNQYFTFTNS